MSEDVDPFEVAMAALDDVHEDQEKKESSETDPFEAAISAAEDSTAPAKDDSPETEAADPFAAAMASLEDGGAQGDPVDSALQVAKADQQTVQTSGSDSERSANVNFLMDIKLTITFEVGRAKMFISDLLSLGQGSVIELHRLVGEELEIFVNGQMFATGEVVVVNEKFGARITKILAPEERIQRLGPES